MRLTVFIFVLLFPVLAVSQLVSTEVNLRGNLQQLSLPADGIFDFEVAMSDSSTGGVELGLVQLDGIVVSDGRYAFPVDFGAGQFDGGPRWIEVRVREDGTTGPYEVLQPRIPIRVVPYAEVALNIAGGYVPPDQACATGEYVAGFDLEGFVICASDANAGGTVTQVDAGSGLTGGPITSAGTLAVDTTQIQARVSGSCLTNQKVLAINQDGTVNCGEDADSGDITAVSAGNGLLGGATSGDATLAVNTDEQTVTVADGTLRVADGAITTSKLADGSVTALKVDPTAVQVRVVNSCAPGFYLTAIAEDGTVTCSPDQSSEVADLETRIAALEQMLAELPTTSETAATGVCFDSSGLLLPCPNFFVGDDIRGLWSGSMTADASVVDVCSEDAVELNVIGFNIEFPDLGSITQRRTGVAPEIVNFSSLSIDARFLSHQYTAYGEDISFTLRFNTNDATGDWIQTNGPCFGTWSFVKVP